MFNGPEPGPEVQFFLWLQFVSQEHPGNGRGGHVVQPDPSSSARASSLSFSVAERGDMDSVPDIINISISLRIQPNEGPVFYKVDGTRFGQTRTIKLLTGSKYKIEVVMKPGTVEAT